MKNEIENIKTLHREFLISDKYLIKVFKSSLNGHVKFDSLTFILNDSGVIQDISGYGFICDKVYDDETLLKEIFIWANSNFS